MIDLILWLAIGGVSVAGLSQYISRLIDSEISYQSSQLPTETPPENPPENSEHVFNLPTIWGGPPPTIPGVNDAPVTAENVFPSVPDLSTRPHTGVNQDSISGSAVQVTNEPGVNRPRTGGEPGGEPELEPEVSRRFADLLSLCPFPVVGAHQTDEYDLFSMLKALGKNQTDIIKTMYGLSKNGSHKYQQARERYMGLAKAHLTINWRNSK